MSILGVCVTILTIAQLFTLYGLFYGGDNHGNNNKYDDCMLLYHSSLQRCLPTTRTTSRLNTLFSSHNRNDLISETNYIMNDTLTALNYYSIPPISPISTKYPLPRPSIGSNSSLVIMVLSRNDDFQRRQTIRKTWARKRRSGNDRINSILHDDVLDYIYFVVGDFCYLPENMRKHDDGDNLLCQVKDEPLARDYSSTLLEYKRNTIIPNQIKLWNEQQQYHDMLVMDSTDVYRNLPQKIKAMYTFVDQYLSSHVQWILKVDDDMFVRPDMFRRYIDKQTILKEGKATMMDPTKYVVLGRLQDSNYPHNQGKWKEVIQYPDREKYPTFPLGSAGHLVSRPVASYIAKYQDYLFNYQGEDVSLGIWLAAGSHLRIPNPPQGPALQIRYLPSTVMIPEGNCTDKTAFVLGHDFKEEKLLECTKYWEDKTDEKKNKKDLFVRGRK